MEPVEDAFATPVDWTAPGTQRITLGRVWTRNFPGTVGLYGCVDLMTHSYSYKVGDEPHDSTHALLGYVAVEPLTGMQSLQGSLTLAASRVLMSRHLLLLPQVTVDASGAYIEPQSLRSPGATTDVKVSRSSAPHRLWPLFEIVEEGGGYRYSTTPDDWAATERRGQQGPVAVAALALDGTVLSGSTLHEIRYRGLGTYGYVSGPDELAAGVDVADDLKVLGDVTERPRESVPLVRLHPGPGVENPPAAPGHRLSIDWQAAVDEGFEPEGVVGYVSSPDTTSAPLLRWLGARDFDWRLTLGTRPTDPAGGWVFDGTLGTAWQPGIRRMGLVDLHEMALGSLVTYATDPAEFEPLGFVSRRVVARVLATRDPGSLPLYRLALENESPWLFSPCPEEAGESGFARQGIVGFVGPGVPPVISVEPWRAEVPDWGTVVGLSDGFGDEVMGMLANDRFPGAVAVSQEVEGAHRVFVGPPPADAMTTSVLGYAPNRPVPFGVPVYRVKHLTGGGESFTSTPPDDPERVIESTCCYLLTPQSAGPTGIPAPPEAPGRARCPTGGPLERRARTGPDRKAGRGGPPGRRRQGPPRGAQAATTGLIAPLLGLPAGPSLRTSGFRPPSPSSARWDTPFRGCPRPSRHSLRPPASSGNAASRWPRRAPTNSGRR